MVVCLLSARREELWAGEAVAETLGSVLWRVLQLALPPYTQCSAGTLGLPFAVSNSSPVIDSDSREAKASPS